MNKKSLADSIDPTNNPYFAPTDGRCLINDLPTELLSQIFVVGADSELDPATHDEDEDDDYSDGSLSSLDSGSRAGSPSTSKASEASFGSSFERHLPFELLVSRVCTRWRAVAVETPTLWTNIEFQEPFNLDRAREYVRRAKGAPLDISIDCTVEEDEMLDDEAEWLDEATVAGKPHFVALREVLDLLKPHVEQWKTLELMVSHYLLMQHALTVFASCSGAPILEVMGLYHYEDSEESERFVPPQYKEQDFVLFQNNLPKIKEVALWGVHVDWPKTTFLSELHDIEFAYHALDVRPSYFDFQRILKSSPRLQTLTLCQSGPAGMPVDWLESVKTAMNLPPEKPPTESLLDITLPSVANLVLAFLSPDYVLALLDHIRLPSVMSLALDFEQDEYTPVLARLAEPAAGTSKSVFAGIEALKLSGLPCSHVPTLVAAAGALQNMKQLSINFTHVDYLWLDLLIAPEAIPEAGLAPGTSFFPRLEALSVTAIDGATVRDIVEKRRAIGRPLKEVYLNREEQLWPEDQTWLRENLEVFELFEGSDDEDVIDEVDDILDLDDVDEEDIMEDDQDENWTDDDDFDEDFDDDEDEEFDVMFNMR
ncbi:hypothetical protein PsYK624_133650 [Phanerochaete sordida]|uniref:F-box domain-containing protein n=1 Tax=Phanerochaete sordida TaxID=48140 RepID=A0A9P3LJC2_9APHY|nr:hypothetical protein PsYK624_133650 [Phanerochaete sordida]